MQRYRINYRMLFGVTAGTLVVAALAFFLIHPWQVDRKANRFRDRAAEALASNNLREAFDNQFKYVRFRSEDDEARIDLANVAVDLSDSDGATQDDLIVAYQILDETVRRTSDPKLRRKLADMLMMFGRPQDAIVHIEELLEDDPNNSELQALRVRALFATKDSRRATELALGLVGYDKKSKEFDAEKAAAGDQPEIYALLANALHAKSSSRDQELARRVIDQMVAANPESAKAHLQRSVFLQKIGESEEATLALEKAHSLDPDDADILLLEGHMAYQDKDYDKALEYFKKGLKLHPEKMVFYQIAAQVEAVQGRFDEALKVLDDGIKQFGEEEALGLVILKIDLLLGANDLDKAKKEVEAFAKVAMKNPSFEPIVGYQQALIKYHEKRWAEAVEAMRKVRPLLFRFPVQQARAGVMIGRANEQLGKYDLALQSYELILQDQPNHPDALAGQKRVLQRIRPDEYVGGFDLNRIVRQTLALPEDQQDWSKIDDQITQFAQERELSEDRVALLRAQVLLGRGSYSGAEGLIRKAAQLDPDNINVRLAAVKLLLADPARGPAKALEQLNKFAQQYGSSLQTRALRVEIHLALGGDDVAAQLRALADGTEEWSDSEQAQLYSTLGIAFQQLGLFEDALQYWNRASTLLPDSLPVRMHLFEVALQQNDDAVIADAQQKVLDLVQDKNDANYVLTEVRRRLMGFTRESVSREELLEARGMLDAALQRRPEWNDLHIAYGQVLVLLNEDLDIALQHLDDALKFGPASANAVALQVQLLAKRGQYESARNKMDRIPTAARPRLLGGVEAEVLLETGDSEGALQIAERIAEEQPDAARTQQWFAKLAQRIGRLDTAAGALQRVTRLVPAAADNWTQLLALYAMQKKSIEFDDAYRAARLAVDADFIPLIAAKAYELRGFWQAAERIYLTTFADRFDEVAPARRMAEFYLLWTQADPANRTKAASYINRILRAYYEGQLSSNDPNVVWARNQAARQLASSGDYQQSLKAQELLVQGAVDGKLSVEERMLQAEVLASLSDPSSQGKAIRILTELQQNQQLQKKGLLLLAELLRKANQWERCERLMLNAIGTYGADVQIWSTYIAMLIERGEYSQAQSRINRLEDLDPQGATYKRLLAQLAAKQGNQELVRKTLGDMLPKNIRGALDANQLQAVLGVAQLAIQCEDLELATELFKLYVARVPEAAFQLTQFQAIYGDVGVAMEEMQEAFNERMDEVLALAARMLRMRRAELGDRYDEEIDRMVAIAMRDDPDSAQRQLFRAEILEIEQKYQESADAYDKLLQRSDVPPRIRATAMNNLAFLLAVLGERLDEAEQLVNQAMEVFGPIAPLLDTRAVVAMAQGKYDQAVVDLTNAVTVSREPVSYFHLAKAQLLSGDEPKALSSWGEANQLGLEKGKLPILEQSEYDEIKARIEKIDKP